MIEKPNRLKGICTAVNVLSIISKVVMWFAIVGLGIAMICIPFILKDVKVVGNQIAYKEYKVTFDEEKDTIMMNDEKVGTNEDKVAFKAIKDVLEKHSTEKITFTGEMICAAGIVLLVVLLRILTHIMKLAKNIKTKETPFIEENIIHIRKMGGLMIASMIISIVISVILSIMYSDSSTFNLDTYSVILILITFAVAHIFEYGMILQKDSKKKIYE